MVYFAENSDTSLFSEGLRVLLMSYTKAINNQEGRTGSLFQQNTASKLLADEQHALTCFHYIHQNPLAAGWVARLEQWEYSSFQEYAGLRNGRLVNKKLASALLALPEDADTFCRDSCRQLPDEFVRYIFG